MLRTQSYQPGPKILFEPLSVALKTTDVDRYPLRHWYSDKGFVREWVSKLRCRRRCSEVHLSPLFSLLLNFCRWFLLENLHMTKQSYVVVNIDNKKETSFKWLCCRAITSKKPKTPMDNYGDYGYSPTIEQSRQSNKGKTHFTRAYHIGSSGKFQGHFGWINIVI